MSASESPHLKNFHIPYIKRLLGDIPPRTAMLCLMALYCGMSVLLSDVKGNRWLSDRLYQYNDDAALAELMENEKSKPLF